MGCTNKAADNASEEKGHYGAIDGLRTCASICIVLYHVLLNGNYNLNGFVFDVIISSFLNLVFLFMVISGFSMCCGYYDKIIKNKINISEFYARRYTRIWPFFAMLCILDFIVSPSINSIYEIFANLTLCFGILPYVGISVIGVGWFLGIVFVFYLIFPFFCFLLSDKKRAWFSFVIMFVFNIVCKSYFHADRENFIYDAVFFFAGGLIFLYKEFLEKLAYKHRWWILLFCFIAACTYYMSGRHISLMLVLSVLLVIYALGTPRRILQNRITKFIGGISMEIYLCHMVIYRGLEKVGCLHLFSNDLLSYSLTSVLVIAGAIMFSYIMQRALKFVSIFINKKAKREIYDNV